MIDFHSHILPGMDDGSSSPEESLAMLEVSAEQGVDEIFATSHFYPDEEDPASFLERRKRSCEELKAFAVGVKKDFPLPRIHLGAEVYYFPGIATCEEIRPLAMGETKMLLVEPPVAPFNRVMLDEIEAIGPNLGLTPVIAHLDRYCRLLRDNSLFSLLSGRKILVQVNASFFLRSSSSEFAMKVLREEKCQLLGSDCHNLTDRPPNIGPAAEKIREKNYSRYLAILNERGYNVLNLG